MISNRDIRGELIELLDKPHHINYITIKKGYARGGHSHDYSEMFLLVEGTVEFIEPEKIIRMIHGDSVVTKPNVPHCIYSTEDAVLVEVRDAGIKFKANEDPKLRAFVEFMKSYPNVEDPVCYVCGERHPWKKCQLSSRTSDK